MAGKKRGVNSELISFEPYKGTKTEDYMNSKQRQHFLEILEKWKSQLLAEALQTVKDLQGEDGSFADPLDRAVQEEDFSLKLRTRDRERKLILKIDEAIQRIESNEYGYCDVCGAEIGIRRLEVRPTATQCIDCKTFEEIREKQTDI